MASGPDFTGSSECLSSEWYEYLCMLSANPTLITPEEVLISQNIPEFLLPSTSSALEHPYQLLLGTLSDPRSAQGTTPDSSLPFHGVSGLSNVTPQIIDPVEDMPRLCAICSVPVSLPPPIPPPPVVTFPPPNWYKIPQKLYGHGKKQWDFTPLVPISFSVDGFPGVNMGDALNKIYTGLEGRDDLVLQNSSSAF